MQEKCTLGPLSSEISVDVLAVLDKNRKNEERRRRGASIINRKLILKEFKSTYVGPYTLQESQILQSMFLFNVAMLPQIHIKYQYNKNHKNAL